MQAGQAAPQRPSLTQTAMNPLARAYQLYQQYVGEPFQQAVRGGVRGYFGLPMMTDASSVGREAYRQGEALGFTPGVGMPAGAVRVAAEGMQALPSIAGDIGRVIGGLPSGAAARQAEDFAAYQRSIPPSDVSPLTAFHGTPHTFAAEEGAPLGRFRAGKIGSGEGAQAYGYGLYFAESPGVAGSYRTTLSSGAKDRLKIDGKPVNTDTMFGRAVEDIPRIGLQATLQKIDDNIRFNNKYAPDIANMYRSIRQQVENIDPSRVTLERGSLYTVDIPDAMVDKMLDWNKPLSEQPENVQEALNKLPQDIKDYIGIGKYDDLKAGVDILNPLGGLIGDAKASELLRQVGIPGIRYLDQGSRADGQGTRNIVVFPGEEQNVKILSRE
jgi:hypothetical protein